MIGWDPRHPVVVCVGTRPEAIKLAPVIVEFERRAMSVVVVATGQHREMLAQALRAWDIKPDVDLHLMRPNQSLAELTSGAVAALDTVIAEARPSAVVVQGDTTTAFSGALAALYQRVPVGHVEAGLRTGILTSPFPEEANRRLITQLSTWHFCPTDIGRQNLLREGVADAAIHVTGNTVIDAALSVAERIGRRGRRSSEHRKVLVTLHRRESHGQTLTRISEALVRLAARDDVRIIFPVHLSPAVRANVMPVLRECPNVTLCDPLGYEDMIGQLATADLVLTDSGGLQEEAPTFGVPVLVLRDTTERPEGLAAGCSVLCGTDPDRILATAARLLDDADAYARMAAAKNPYGDGHAAERVADALAAALTRGSGELVAKDMISTT